MLGNDVQIKQLVGVGDVHLNFQPDQRVYCLIGENGIGKTKCLEALFTAYAASNKRINKIVSDLDTHEEIRKFKSFTTENLIVEFMTGDYVLTFKDFRKASDFKIPFVISSINNRGSIEEGRDIDNSIGNLSKRKSDYFLKVAEWFYTDNKRGEIFSNDIKEWVVQRAQSANPYQAAEDNREVEIITLLNLLNQVDERIDSKFLEISGSNRVFIKVSDKKTELSKLSSGFASILKIMQSIIAGYSYFTNETNIAHVKGVVFIDEIESHLHTKWQATIIPTLKRLFPNTTFYITTHSAIVLSQLQHGEAYELYRDKEDGIVKTELIEHPNNAAFIDLLKDAFDIDINRLKLARDNAPQQKNAKKMLSELLEKRINEIKEGTQ